MLPEVSGGGRRGRFVSVGGRPAAPRPLGAVVSRRGAARAGGPRARRHAAAQEMSPEPEPPPASAPAAAAGGEGGGEKQIGGPVMLVKRVGPKPGAGVGAVRPGAARGRRGGGWLCVGPGPARREPATVEFRLGFDA